jgi:hypothetical protein
MLLWGTPGGLLRGFVTQGAVSPPRKAVRVIVTITKVSCCAIVTGSQETPSEHGARPESLVTLSLLQQTFAGNPQVHSQVKVTGVPALRGGLRVNPSGSSPAPCTWLCWACWIQNLR